MLVGPPPVVLEPPSELALTELGPERAVVITELVVVYAELLSGGLLARDEG